MEEKMRIESEEKTTEIEVDSRKSYIPPEVEFLGNLTIGTQTSVEFTFE